MAIRIKVKQSSECETCDGIGYYSISPDEKYYDDYVEYVCNDCDGTGKIWKDRDLPISSLKRLLKDLLK